MKKKKNLVYIPTGLNSPELEILLSKSQILIDKKKSVTIVVCSGGKNYYCSKNIYSIKSICILCKNLRNKGISKLKGNFKLLRTPSIIQANERGEIFNYEKLITEKYKNFDIGYGVYASYVAATRDMELESINASYICSRLLNTSKILSKYFENLLNTKQFDHVVLYNGRMNQYRPLFRITQNKKINVSNMEFSGSNNQTYDFKNFFSMDLNNLSKKINFFWKKKKKTLNKNELIKFFSDRFNDSAKLRSKSFVSKQDSDLLPSNWNKNKINIVYYSASNDELISYGKEYSLGYYQNQNDIFYKLAKTLQKKDFSSYNLWIRMHPNLSNLRWSFVRGLGEINKNFKNVFVIPPESKISTYKLMIKADIIMGTSSSFTLAEANHLGKPTIAVGPNIWNKIGVSITPKNHNDLEKIIKNIKFKKINAINSLKYAAFRMYGGFQIKYLTGDKNYNYYFNNYSIKLDNIHKIFYFLAKIKEKLITKIFFNNIFNLKYRATFK